jgi:hypothetical protein
LVDANAPKRRRLFVRGLTRAATGKVNISAFGAAAVGAAAMQSWPVLAIGGATYAALVAWDLVSGNFWENLIKEPAREHLDTLPNAHAVRDTEVRVAVERIHAARASIHRALAEAPPHVSAQVELSLTGLDELEARAGRLVELAEGLTRHLTRVDARALAREVSDLSAKAETAHDPESRSLYAQAAKDRRDQLDALEDVARARERMLANLTRIVSHLEGVPTRVVRMGVLDAESVGGSTDDIGSEIGKINGDLAAMEQTLEVLVGEKFA